MLCRPTDADRRYSWRSNCRSRPRSTWYTTSCPHKKGATDCFTITFTNMAGFLWLFGTQLFKWILIILVKLLRCVPCTSLTWWHNVDVTEITPFTVRVTLSPCCRERCQILSLQTCGHPICQIWIWGMLQERVYHSRIHDVKELKERLLSKWRLLDHTIITAAIAQWCSRLNALCSREQWWTFWL